jgi:hypothetical protein
VCRSTRINSTGLSVRRVFAAKPAVFPVFHAAGMCAPVLGGRVVVPAATVACKVYLVAWHAGRASIQLTLRGDTARKDQAVSWSNLIPAMEL